MQFEQVIVLLFDQSVDASKASKSFQNRADLFVIVSKLIKISKSAFTIEDGFSPPKSLGTFLRTIENDFREIRTRVLTYGSAKCGAPYSH